MKTDQQTDQIVHYMGFGMTACLVNGPPSKWPSHHVWTNAWPLVTCPACLAGKELVLTYSISPDGTSITCLRCKLTSHHPEDVEHHYCGKCRVFHDDLWPPARKAWMEQTNPKHDSTYMLKWTPEEGGKAVFVGTWHDMLNLVNECLEKGANRLVIERVCEMPPRNSSVTK